MGGMASQNILNIVDTAMVGSLGSISLAATGLGAFMVFLSTAFVQGFGSGVQAIVARRFGEKMFGRLALPLNGGLVIAVSCGIFLTALYWFVAPILLPLINDDPEILSELIPYYRYRILGAVAIGCNYSFRGFWNGTNRPSIYLQTLVIMHLTNIVLNYLLIFGKLGAPQLGSSGAALASCIATYTGLLVYCVQALRLARGEGFISAWPSRKLLVSLIRLSTPAGIQITFLAAGFVTLFWIVGLIGPTELAALNIIMNVNLVGILPSMGLGFAAGALVGQALGEHDPDDAYRWAWDVVKVGLILVMVIAMPLIFAPKLIFSLFISEPEVIDVGTLPLQMAGCILLIEALSLILMNSLMGAGANRMSMKISIFSQWCLGLPLAFLLGPTLGYGLVGVWVAQGIYRVVLCILYVSAWRSGKWRSIEL